MPVVKKLEVKYSADIKSLQTKLKRMEGDLKTSNAAVKKTSNQFAGMWKQMLGGQVAFAMVSKGLRSINRLMKDSIKAYGEQEKVERLLQTALQQTGKYSQAAFNDLKAYASQIQELTTVGDETSLKLMQLGLSMGVSSDKIKDATKAAIGLSKAYDVDLKSAMKMVALAYEGDFNMLQRYMPELKKLKDNTEKQAIAFKRFGEGWGIATAETDTAQGALDQLNNTIGDFKERIGESLTGSDEFKESIQKIKDIFADPDFAQGILNVITSLSKFTGKLMEAAEAILNFGIASASLDKASQTRQDLFDSLTDKFSKFIKTADLAAGELITLKTSFDMATMSGQSLEQINDNLTKLLKDISNKGYGEKLAKDWKKFREEQQRLNAEASETKDTLGKEKGVTKAVEEFKFEMDDTSDQLKDTEKDVEDFRDEVTKLKPVIVDVGGVTKDWDNVLAELSKDINQVGQSVLGLGETLGLDTGKFGGVLDSLTTGITQAFSGDIVGAVASGIDLIAGLFDLFKGQDPIEAAMEDWNELLDEGKIGTKEMWDLMRQLRWEGTELDEIQDHIAESINKGIGALSDYYGYAATSQERFNRAQLYTLAMFSGLMAQGMSFIDAIYEMGDAFTELLSIIQDTGYEVNEALDFMLGLTDFIAENEDLASAIGAVGDILDSVFESGIYNIEQLQSMIHTVGADLNDMFNQVIAAGGTQEQAWAMVIPTLNDLIYYANEYGLTIDENTQKLIDAAREQGYLSEIQVPPMEKLVEIMEVMLDMWSQFLGITYSLSWELGNTYNQMEKLKNITDEVNLGEMNITPGTIPEIGAASGFAGILGQDTTIHAHEGEGALIIPKSDMQQITNNTRGDVNYNWSFPMTNGGKMSDNELEGRLIGLVKRRGQLVDVMNRELD